MVTQQKRVELSALDNHMEMTEEEMAVRMNCFARQVFTEVEFIKEISITLDDDTVLTITRERIEAQKDN